MLSTVRQVLSKKGLVLFSYGQVMDAITFHRPYISDFAESSSEFSSTAVISSWYFCDLVFEHVGSPFVASRIPAI